MVLLLFGMSVYLIMSYTLNANIDSALKDAAYNIISQSRGIPSTGGLQLPRLDSPLTSVIFVQAIRADGNVEAQNISFDEYLDPDTIKKLMADSNNTSSIETYSTYAHAGKTPLRVLTLRLIGGESRTLFGYLQVAQPIDDIERAKSGLLAALALVGGVGLFISAAAGAAMARRALQPVDQITQTAVDIYRAEDLKQRVQVSNTQDEVARLGMAFNEMLERLARLFRAQQRLVADVSHELRTPLTVIRGNVDLMRAMKRCDDESLDAITKEAERMTRMVSNLLMLSQADVGQLPMSVKQLDLAGIIGDIERSANIMANGRVHIESSVCGELAVRGDADRIKQVLLNLVDNALKHTPDGGTVSVVADCVDEDGEPQVQISVRDTGIGIPEADLPHVFERFYRVDKSRSRDLGGAGLGLAIAQSIVAAHGGKIEVHSKVGEGTSFDVWLPAYQPNVV
jgi:signal transduction histidine kinase